MKVLLVAFYGVFLLVSVVDAKLRGETDHELSYRKLLVEKQVLNDHPTHHLGGNSLTIRNLKKGNPGKQNGSKDDGDDDGDDNDDDGCFAECDPAGVNLEDYPQWQEEEGYWIGDYTFYQGDGTPFVSGNWNYRYDSYKGFITGNVNGNAYRQRNVFFYPPQNPDVCETNDSVIGVGTCGVNGNTKLFEADQSATTCTTNPENAGDINGPFREIFDTTTELIGQNNALLYQVFLFGALFQSQLTTLTVDSDLTVRRTRSAQSFAEGVPRSMSFYRERKVDKETFYAEMAATIAEYNILESDTCAWVDNPTFDPPIIPSDVAEAGIGGCMAHLEESFSL